MEKSTDPRRGEEATRYVVAEFFSAHGMSESCRRVICDRDAWVAARRGIDFERTGTAAGGAARRDFRYHLPAAGAGGMSHEDSIGTSHIDPVDR